MPFLSFDLSYPKISIHSLDLSNVGVYKIKVIGVLSDRKGTQWISIEDSFEIDVSHC